MNSDKFYLAKVRVAGSNPVVRSKKVLVEGTVTRIEGTHSLPMGSQWEDDVVGDSCCAVPVHT
jgi:hypothetical protein